MAGKHKLIGIGECMVELSPAGNGLLRQSFAGDVLNTLWYASAAFGPEWSTGFLSAVGTDPLSQGMIKFIESGGIECDLVRRLPGRRPGLY
ncbi:MAG: sugar kinase, partial [Aestuariivirgaceae bacterium]